MARHDPILAVDGPPGHGSSGRLCATFGRGHGPGFHSPIIPCNRISPSVAFSSARPGRACNGRGMPWAPLNRLHCHRASCRVYRRQQAHSVAPHPIKDDRRTEGGPSHAGRCGIAQSLLPIVAPENGSCTARVRRARPRPAASALQALMGNWLPRILRRCLVRPAIPSSQPMTCSGHVGCAKRRRREHAPAVLPTNVGKMVAAPTPRNRPFS